VSNSIITGFGGSGAVCADAANAIPTANAKITERILASLKNAKAI
jgi:hypothetical protein